MKRFIHLIVPAAVALAGCDSSDTDDTDRDRTDHRGAWVVQFQSLGASCGLVGHTAQVGQVSGTTLTQLEQDGEDGADIECRVTPAGDGFDVQASAAKEANALQISVTGLSTAATETDWVAGSVVFSSAQTVNQYETPPAGPCHFYFSTDEQKNATAEGKVWLSFDCPVIEYAAGSSQCTLQPSHAAFDRCDR